jgi:hypothetical protein
MRSSKSEDSTDETKDILFYCILCKQKICVSKDSRDAVVAFDEKGLLPHNCPAKRQSDYSLSHLRSPGMQEAEVNRNVN